MHSRSKFNWPHATEQFDKKVGGQFIQEKRLTGTIGTKNKSIVAIWNKWKQLPLNWERNSLEGKTHLQAVERSLLFIRLCDGSTLGKIVTSLLNLLPIAQKFYDDSWMGIDGSWIKSLNCYLTFSGSGSGSGSLFFYFFTIRMLYPTPHFFAYAQWFEICKILLCHGQ